MDIHVGALDTVHWILFCGVCTLPTAVQCMACISATVVVVTNSDGGGDDGGGGKSSGGCGN